MRDESAGPGPGSGTGPGPGPDPESGRHARRFTGALAVTALLAALVALWQTQSAPMVGPDGTPVPPTPATPRPSGDASAPARDGFGPGYGPGAERPVRAIPPEAAPRRP
ncbi:hypothetical protein ACH4PU_02630 [Streptomyces sp. NPDC021100]|uniref:hypothetical protein n=1 Tax=Streptomyces sp. NPDC021100 TaxID=3365114 RepID=UPI0037961355